MESNARRRCSRPHPRRVRPTPYPLRSYRWKVPSEGILNRTSMALEQRDWEDATCSVCMEFPHNAVLLLCSSHDKGCRPYMCGTSYRHSNCLDQFKKAYTKTHELAPPTVGEHLTTFEKPEAIELAACPLCRGQVKGWTVVQAAREYLNSKKRSCMQDECSFAGTYRDLQKHVRSEHPCAKPREVDPTMQQKWSRLEHEREREDVISTIRSSMPRSVVFGDYVIEMGNSDGEDSEEEVMGGDGNSRGISRSILYFFLREGARLMRIHREPNGGIPTLMAGREEHDEDDDDDDEHPSIGSIGISTDIDTSVVTAYSSGGDDDYRAVGAEHGRRRRRRRRSRGRSVVGLS